MTVKRLDPSHAAAYRALMLEAFQLHPDAFISSYAERAALPPSSWEARLKEGPQPSDLVLGAFEGGGRLAGVVGLHFDSREKARHKATLVGMYVSAQFRRHGLGRSLVDAALAEARARPVRLVQLMMTHGNRAAQDLYERCGFVQYGLEPLAVRVGDGFVSKVHMWCDLDATKSHE